MTVIALALLGCSTETPEARPERDAPTAAKAREGAPNVVVVTLDTTRADRIGAYGYQGGKTPVLDGLAARGRRYDRAYSPLPLTIPSHATLFTGQLPPTHGIRNNGGGRLHPEAQTLAEIFNEAGYATAASVSAFVTTRRWGFDQGFEEYFDDIVTNDDFWHSERPANEVIDDVLAWRTNRAKDRPEFVWVHLYDPHFPYRPPEAFQKQFPNKPYDAELAWTDSQLGRLVEAYEGQPTVFVVVADHGEALGEHGEKTHGLFVYDSTQRVPLIIAGPGIDVAVIDEPVSLADVGPTLLSLVDLPAFEEAEGRVAPGDPVKPVYMESYQPSQRFGLAPHVAVVVGDHKLIATPTPEVYAHGDVGELTNVAETADLAALQAAMKDLGYAPPKATDVVVDPDVGMQLQALGYADGDLPTGDLAKLPDPKDHVDLIEGAQLIDRLAMLRKPKEMLTLLDELCEKYPDVTEFSNRKASALSAMGRFDEALVLVRAARQKKPKDGTLMHSEATLLAHAGRFREAAVLYARAAEEMAFAPRVRAAAFSALLDAKGDAEAFELGANYLQQHPDDYALAGVMGVALVKRNRIQKGVELLELGALASRPEKEVSYHLAAIAQGRKDGEEAKRLLRHEITHWPRNLPARITLIRLIVETRDWEAVLAEAEQFLMLDKSKGEVHFWKAQSLFNLKRYDEVPAALAAGYAADPEDPQLLTLEANLLAHNGDREAGVKKFEQAKQAQEKEQAAAKAKLKKKAAKAPAQP